MNLFQNLYQVRAEDPLHHEQQLLHCPGPRRLIRPGHPRAHLGRHGDLFRRRVPQVLLGTEMQMTSIS